MSFTDPGVETCTELQISNLDIFKPRCTNSVEVNFIKILFGFILFCSFCFVSATGYTISSEWSVVLSFFILTGNQTLYILTRGS